MSSNRPYKKMPSEAAGEYEMLTHKFVTDLMRINQRLFEKRVRENRDVASVNFILNAYDVTMSVQEQISTEVREFLRTAAVAMDEIESEARETLQRES